MKAPFKIPHLNEMEIKGIGFYFSSLKGWNCPRKGLRVAVAAAPAFLGEYPCFLFIPLLSRHCHRLHIHRVVILLCRPLFLRGRTFR